MTPLTDHRYRLLERLEQDPSGQRWLADKLDPRGVPVRPVVLKVAPPGGDAEEARRRAALFERELVVTATLEHRNIIHVDGWGSDLFGSSPFFEMPHPQGLSLRELLERRRGSGGALPAQDVAWIGAQLATGLRYAHAHDAPQLARAQARARARALGAAPLLTPLTLQTRGVAHRGIWPGAIALDVYGDAKLTDWSITEPFDTVRHDRATFMSPEQLRGRSDGRSDVYSLGVTLTVALTGRDVFTPSTADSSARSSSRALLTAVLEGDREPVAELAPHAPPALQGLLESMMDTEPERRPSTDELIERFNGIVNALGDAYDVQQELGVRVAEHYRAPRRPARLRLVHGGGGARR